MPRPALFEAALHDYSISSLLSPHLRKGAWGLRRGELWSQIGHAWAFKVMVSGAWALAVRAPSHALVLVFRSPGVAHSCLATKPRANQRRSAKRNLAESMDALDVLEQAEATQDAGREGGVAINTGAD